ncbi:MAG: hypothetical protein ABI306_00885 [Caulobacteraceae bacterium]
MSPNTQGKTRLESWKEIAAWFRRGERTVMRWETERGLPVRRMPGLDKSRVYAEIADLEAWRRGSAAALSEPATAPGAAGDTALANPPAPRRTWAPWWVAAGAAGVLAAIALIANAPAFTGAPKPPSLAAQRLYVAGMDDWAARTPAGLNRAVGEFGAAIARDPDYAEAYTGLANSYNLLREYTLMPSSQAFPLARTAALHALALNDRLASAHAALAFANFYGFWDAASARREFARAIALDPTSETSHHWFATFLMTQGDNAGALRQIDIARALDPASPAIAADRAVILYAAGRKTEALADIKVVEAAHPDFLSPHNYLANFALIDGDDEGYARESQIAAGLTDDPLRVALASAAREGLKAGGRRAMLQAILAEQTRQLQSGGASAYDVARTRAMLGDAAGAKTFLRLSLDRREAEITIVGVDKAFDPLRGDPEFQHLARWIRPG